MGNKNKMNNMLSKAFSHTSPDYFHVVVFFGVHAPDLENAGMFDLGGGRLLEQIYILVI